MRRSVDCFGCASRLSVGIGGVPPESRSTPVDPDTEETSMKAVAYGPRQVEFAGNSTEETVTS